MEEVVKEKLMTAKGVAEQLKCSERIIRDYASKLGFTVNCGNSSADLKGNGR